MTTPTTRAATANPTHARPSRDSLRAAGVTTISVIGGPGCGKTTLIDATIERLMSEVHVGVVACDVVSRRDADRLARHSRQGVQVNTGAAGHAIDRGRVLDAIGTLDLDWIDLLFVENVGSLTGPATGDVGQDVTVAIFSVVAGDDKADKHPDLVAAADVIVLNKVDLLGAVPFDVEAFRADVRRINPKVRVIEMSGLRSDGIDAWLGWLRNRLRKSRHPEASHWFG